MYYMIQDVDPRTLFGADLNDIFGPKAERVHISKICRKELRKRLAKVEKYLCTDHLGPYPTMYQVTNYALGKLKQSRALWGIELDWCDTLVGCGIRRHISHFYHVKYISKNHETQRGLHLRHVVEDIMFRFDPKSVLTGLARYSEKNDRYYINDGQHRLVASVIMGIREVPLEPEDSELKSTDLRHYAIINLNSLPPTEYDRYRTMVKAIEYAKEEGEVITDPEYLRAWTVKNILDRYSCKMVEQGTARAALACTGVGNLLKHHRDYDSTIFERAISINAIAHTKAPLAAQNIVGICEFLYTQGASRATADGKIGAHHIDICVADALLHYTPKRNRNGFYLDVNRALTIALGAKKDKELSIPYEKRIAAGIEKLIRAVHPEVEWKGIKFDGKNIADEFLGDFKFIPVRR